MNKQKNGSFNGSQALPPQGGMQGRHEAPAFANGRQANGRGEDDALRRAAAFRKEFRADPSAAVCSLAHEMGMEPASRCQKPLVKTMGVPGIRRRRRWRHWLGFARPS